MGKPALPRSGFREARSSAGAAPSPCGGSVCGTGRRTSVPAREGGVALLASRCPSLTGARCLSVCFGGVGQSLGHLPRTRGRNGERAPLLLCKEQAGRLQLAWAWGALSGPELFAEGAPWSLCCCGVGGCALLQASEGGLARPGPPSCSSQVPSWPAPRCLLRGPGRDELRALRLGLAPRALPYPRSPHHPQHLPEIRTFYTQGNNLRDSLQFLFHSQRVSGRSRI